MPWSLWVVSRRLVVRLGILWCVWSGETYHEGVKRTTSFEVPGVCLAASSAELGVTATGEGSARSAHCRQLPLPGRRDLGVATRCRVNSGPLLRGVTRGGPPRPSLMNDSSINLLVKTPVARAGSDPAQYSAHGLRAGFVTYANLMGQPDRSIARQTRHRSVASIATYVRIQDAWQANAAVELRL